MYRVTLRSYCDHVPVILHVFVFDARLYPVNKSRLGEDGETPFLGAVAGFYT